MMCLFFQCLDIILASSLNNVVFGFPTYSLKSENTGASYLWILISECSSL